MPAYAIPIVRRHPHSPPITDRAILLLKMSFILLPRRTEFDRCDHLARTATKKSTLLSSSQTRPSTGPVVFPLFAPTKIFLSCFFLTSYFHSNDNANTFTFYTSDVISNFVSLSFRHEETHRTIIFPL